MYRVLILLLIFAADAHAGGFRDSAHGRMSAGDAGRPGSVGSCSSCHSEASGEEGGRLPLSLSGADGCVVCHDRPEIEGAWPGSAVYDVSVHALDSRVVWPGPDPRARDASQDAGKCINCHDPHGREDFTGVIGSLLVARDEELCLACHGGRTSATDIDRDLRKPYSHAARRGTGSHSAGEAGDPGAYSWLGGSRHVSCSDCHNVHVARGGGADPVAPEAAGSNAGIDRVRVSNGGPGSEPSYQYLSSAEIGNAVLEYEICFKCHSSWTQAPSGQPDLARLLNPANASHHAVEAAGNNQNLRLDSFVQGMAADTVILCTACHGSDDGVAAGPHGSTWAGMLRRSYEDRGPGVPPDRDMLCFQCHNFETYASENGFAVDASRFNPPASVAGHAIHVGREGIFCRSCHDSHGSADHRALISTDPDSSILQFSSDQGGGSCQSRCHGPRDYRSNYPW